MTTGAPEYNSSSSSEDSSLKGVQDGANVNQKRGVRVMTQVLAWQNMNVLVLLSVLLQAQHCRAQLGMLPPLPPLGLFGGLLDGMGLGPNSPPMSSSPPVTSTYRTPQTAYSALQPPVTQSATSGTIIPVVTSSPASVTPAAVGPVNSVGPVAPTAPSTPDTPATAIPGALATPVSPAAVQRGMALLCRINVSMCT